MNWDQVEGQWTSLKGQAKQKWSKLTDDDLDAIDGKRQELIGRLQKRYGDRKEELAREVDEWQRSI